eukprot:11202841-Lingulodinium_polyedra.AAC.1
MEFDLAKTANLPFFRQVGRVSTNGNFPGSNGHHQSSRLLANAPNRPFFQGRAFRLHAMAGFSQNV